MNKKYTLILVLIILSGLLLRLYSLNYGLPDIVGPDENRQILDAFSMGYRMNLMPQEFAYAALHKYLLLFLYGAYFILGKMLGLFLDKMQFAVKFLTQPYMFYFLARLLSALLGTAVIFITYKIASRIKSPGAGIIAAIFAAFNFHLIQLSYWATVDMLVIFLSALGLLFIYRFFYEPSLKNALIAAFIVGLAISAKLQGAILIFPFMAALIFNKGKAKSFLKIAVFSFLMLFLGSFIGNMPYFLQSAEALERIRVLSQEAKFGISSAPVYSHNVFSVSFWYAKELIRQDGLIGLMYLFGIIYSVVKHKKEDLILLSYVIFFMFSLSIVSLRFTYYLAAIMPLLSVFAARAIIEFLSSMKKYKKTTIYVLVIIVSVFSVKNALIACNKRSQKDTRQIAKEWVEDNITAGTAIGIDWYELNVPLGSNAPFMFRTGNALNYYEKIIPDKIKEAYLKLNHQKIYEILPIIYNKETNFWPKDMPMELVKIAEKNPMIRRLYQRFNFKSLDDLKSDGAKYLIFSSFAYSHFLLDDDPKKIGLYNPYLSEDTLSNNKQAKIFNPAKEESMLFFLAKRARDFYLPILELKNSKMQLIEKFIPDNQHLGPVIEIYKLGD